MVHNSSGWHIRSTIPKSEKHIYQLHSCKMKSREQSKANLWVAIMSYFRSFCQTVQPAVRWEIVQTFCPWGLCSWWCLCEHPWMLHGAPQDWSLWGPFHKCCWRLSKGHVMAARNSILNKLSQIFDAMHLWVLSALFNQEVQSSFGWSHISLKPWRCCFITLLSSLYGKCDILKTHTLEIQWTSIYTPWATNEATVRTVQVSDSKPGLVEQCSCLKPFMRKHHPFLFLYLLPESL